MLRFDFRERQQVWVDDGDVGGPGLKNMDPWILFSLHVLEAVAH